MVLGGRRQPYDAHSLDLGIGIGYSLNEALGFELTYDNMEPDLKGRRGSGDKDEDINIGKIDVLYHFRTGQRSSLTWEQAWGLAIMNIRRSASL